MEKYRILAINPGSASMRMAVYENEDLLFQAKIDHKAENLRAYPSSPDWPPDATKSSEMLRKKA